MRFGRKKSKEIDSDIMEAREEDPREDYDDPPKPAIMVAQKHPISRAIEDYNANYADLNFPSSTDSLLFAIWDELRKIRKDMQE